MATKYAYLIKVEPGQNNNKFYEMKENGDGTFTAEYGRIESTPQIRKYPMSDWDKKLNKKLSSKKGYTDHTHLRSITEVVQTKNSKGQQIIDKDKDVSDIILKLQQFAQAQTAQVYNVKAAAVTQAQIDEAQKHLDELSYSFKHYYGKNFDINKFNKVLVQFFMVIPRKMKNVADHLITKSTTKDEIESLIDDEQSNLDSMASQVVQNKVQDDSDTDGDGTPDGTLTQSLGLKMALVTDKKIIEQVRKEAQVHGQRVNKVYQVINEETQEAFDKHMAKTSNKNTRLLWHGSRNQNWYWIIQQGLKIRPSGAIITGAMWGNGCYFADICNKSWGYTDVGKWSANGKRHEKVYMALYEVHVGKQYEKTRHDSSCYDLHNTYNKYGCDSVWAKAGAGIVMDEFIIYKPEQCTIKYLVEFNV